MLTEALAVATDVTEGADVTIGTDVTWDEDDA